MAAIKYKVKLAESEGSRLNEVSHRGKPSVRTVKRALALLKADEGLRDAEIAGVLPPPLPECGSGSSRKELRPPSMTSHGRAGSASWTASRKRIAIRSSPPEGHVSWTLHLLADKVVDLEFAGSISLETVRQILKKTNSSRGRRKSGAFPR